MAPQDEDDSGAADTEDSPEGFAALSDALDATGRELAAMRAENRDLRAAAAALAALHEHAAYLSSLLARASFQQCTKASSSLPGSTHTAEAAAVQIVDFAYAGGQVQDQMYNVCARLTPSAFVRIDIDMRGRSLQLLTRWKAEPSREIRAGLRGRLLNVIRARERWRNYMAMGFPEALLHYWREGTPCGPGHDDARRAKQAQALASMVLTPEQLDVIRIAWMEYCAGVQALDREAEVWTAMAGITEVVAPEERLSLQSRGLLAKGTMSSVARVRSINARRVALYSRLAHRLTQAMTWVQAVLLPVTMSPYTLDYADLCQKVLQRAPAMGQA